ncbi:MAG: O-antigen ligase family protein [Dehalococcoidia bacterium]
MLVVYGWLIGPLLAGYLLFDKAFAYLHIPGTPLYIGEVVLGIGVLAVLCATGYLRIPVRDEPILALLAVFLLWGLVRAVPGVFEYGLDAVRDSALWYYGMFALLAVAALARRPGLRDRLVAGLARLTPWLLLWLPVGMLLIPLEGDAPVLIVPDSTISVLEHKPEDAAIAALVAIGCLWLLPAGRSVKARVAWALLAFLVLALAATQNRGGLLGVVAGMAVGLVFCRNRVRLSAKALAAITVVLTLAALLPLDVPYAGTRGRAFSVDQLGANVMSLGGEDTTGHRDATAEDRKVLWTRILQKQETDGLLLVGSGFGPNLASQVNEYDAPGEFKVRSPHNSHLDVLARMGVVGLCLWIALWLAWYRRLVVGCRRLEGQGHHLRRRVTVLCLMVATAILVSTFFDPQLEGAQMAALLWTVFGVGVAVTSVRDWSGNAAARPAALGSPSRTPPPPHAGNP